MESYQNDNLTENTDVVIDIPDDEINDYNDCPYCCSCFVKNLTDWFAPPLYASLCVCGGIRCCEATNPNQHVCIVRLRFLWLWIGCMCFMSLPLLVGIII